MAHHKSAKKSIRKSLRRRYYNQGYKMRLKKLEKEIKEGLKLKDKELLKAKLKDVSSLFTKASLKGVIHRNKARRKISKLSKAIKMALTTD